MFNKHAVLFAASALFSLSASAVTSWDLATDYLDNTNPNGAWTYGQVPVYSVSTLSWGGSFSTLAWNLGTSSYGIAAVGETFIYKNNGLSFAFGIDPGKVSLEADWGNPAVRWTAPAAGDYLFTVVIGGSTDSGGGGFGNNYAIYGGVEVNHVVQPANSFITVPGPGGSNVLSFSFTTTLAAGGTVDAYVINPGSAAGGNTQTEFSVTAVPEPASALLLALGVGGLALVGRRRNQGGKATA